MELYFIRHGIAQDPSPDLPDGDRPLTPKGIEKTQRIAQRLKQIDITFDCLLASPLRRAQETAQILLDTGLAPHLETFPPLTPGTPIPTALQQLVQHYHQANRLALIGHQPDLSHWAEYLVFGIPQNKLLLKKAGIIGISLPILSPQPAQGQLFLLTGPRWFL